MLIWPAGLREKVITRSCLASSGNCASWHTFSYGTVRAFSTRRLKGRSKVTSIVDIANSRIRPWMFECHWWATQELNWQCMTSAVTIPRACGVSRAPRGAAPPYRNRLSTRSVSSALSGTARTSPRHTGGSRYPGSTDSSSGFRIRSGMTSAEAGIQGSAGERWIPDQVRNDGTERAAVPLPPKSRRIQRGRASS